MKNILLFLFIALLTAIGFAVWKFQSQEMQETPSLEKSTKQENPSSLPSAQEKSSSQGISSSPFETPLDRPSLRVTKKEFGTFITPENSPVQPERFRGYHTGVDFEVFPEELNEDVTVQALCEGKLIEKRYASGYGGVLVESCELRGEPITIIYGHLKLGSITLPLGASLKPGDPIGLLGPDKSQETDGERKHLHLGIHKGKAINILGYVQNKSELSGWIDPCQYVCGE